jgi:hypothetical protein
MNWWPWLAGGGIILALSADREASEARRRADDLDREARRLKGEVDRLRCEAARHRDHADEGCRVRPKLPERWEPRGELAMEAAREWRREQLINEELAKRRAEGDG